MYNSLLFINFWPEKVNTNFLEWKQQINQFWKIINQITSKNSRVEKITNFLTLTEKAGKACCGKVGCWFKREFWLFCYEAFINLHNSDLDDFWDPFHMGIRWHIFVTEQVIKVLTKLNKWIYRQSLVKTPDIKTSK